MVDINRDNTLPRDIVDEMRESYLNYSMSVIVSRALPDVRDGLKPVHRRILYGMSELGSSWNRPYKKSARIVGDVLGKYHPHGDSSVYDALVRMAQSFSMRYELVDGQGNFGSVDGDNAAAMRYTESRMAKMTSEMLKDLDKETVDWTVNFDETLKEPTVLPTTVPTLLINGSEGIAVGMATKIPPHNLTEVVSGLVSLIDNPNTTKEELMTHIKGPDFPTAGLIMGIMIIPYISSLSDDVINSVPQSLRDGSYAVGATKSETIKKVIIPAALPGIIGSILLAVSRAIGETMIVVMAAGLAANLTINPLESTTTITTQIVMILVGDQEFDSPKTQAAFALGLTLFVATLFLNYIALRVVKKYREQYE